MSTNPVSSASCTSSTSTTVVSSSASSGSQAKSGSSEKDSLPPCPPPSELAERPKLSSKSNDEEILKEVCLNNGVTYSKLAAEGPTLEVLEMFFSGFPRIIGMQHFPNVHTLTIIGQSISALSGLSTLTNLQELWVAECQIQKIKGLDKNVGLKKLYLYGNQISVIENLDHLVELEALWLNNNLIKNIENLTNLVKLRDLNLAENKIEKIGHALSSNIYLEEVNLSGNPISSLRDLTNLVRLPKVVSLSLKDPLYTPCPVSQLCNYSTHVLFHMPGLKRLDTYDVTAKHLGDLAQSTVLKKKMYYNMRSKTVRRCLASLLHKLEEHKDTKLLSFPHQRLRIIMYSMKEIEREIEEKQAGSHKEDVHDSDTESERDAREKMASKPPEQPRVKSTKHKKKTGTNAMRGCVVPCDRTFSSQEVIVQSENAKQDVAQKPQSKSQNEHKVAKQNKQTQGALGDAVSIQALQHKLDALKKRKRHWEHKCAEIEDYFREAKQRLQQAADTIINRLVVELETGGNVRFEEGSSTDLWFSSCYDLVMSRFCASDFRAHSIVGLKIHRIIRIHNRILRSKFDKKLRTVTEGPLGEYYPGTKNTAYKKLLEYLFWMWDPDMAGGALEPGRVPEEGFMDAETYSMLDRDAAVPLSNSLSLADRHRMAALTRHAKGTTSDHCPFRFGQLIIAKTYLGKSAAVSEDRPIAKSAYPKIDSVFKPRSKCFPESHDSGSDHTCECSARQCEWYIFDHELVLPEYIIEFEYITKDPPKSPYAQVSDDLLDNRTVEIPAQPLTDSIHSGQEDDRVLRMAPPLQQRPRLVALTEDLLLKAGRSETLCTITELNLHGNGLTKLKHIQSLTSLKKLVISFNEITRLDEVTHMALEYIDASFNKIVTLEGMKSMTSLHHLDLSWNQLHNTREELSILRKHCSALTYLDLRHNPWLKPEGLRLRVVGRLKSLRCLNEEQITQEESAMALRVAAGSRISQVSLLTNSRTDTMLPRSLSLGSGAQIIALNSRLKPDKGSDTDTTWYSKVTTVHLEGQHITKLSNLDRLENLLWASFDDNDLTKIEGLDCCLKLEDLSLSNNCITRLDGLTKLTRLRRLSLSHNEIHSLNTGALAYLPHLVYLALDNNRLTSLAGLQHSQALVELYIGNNLITNIREIFLLKQLPNLVILDMFGNPVTTEVDNYRLFVVYHLKALKALDGNAIEAQEGNMARDMFGGRLTPDFIAEKLGHATFLDVRELDLPSCSIRTVDLGSGDQFINLRSINLENNNLSSFSGLTSLVNLRVLCLNNNHIECVVPRSKPLPQPKSRYVPGPPNLKTTDYYPENLAPVLEHLEVLHLGYNGIKDMAALQLSRLPSLKALFLQGNEITKVEGLESLHDLRELVLDRNKIKTLSEYDFSNQWNLQELHLEENRIREIGALGCLENLQRLYLGSNRIQDISELEKLDPLCNLVELSVVNNAVARRLLHRVVLVFRMPQLMVIDGIPVTDEERNKAELYFADQIPQQNTTMVEATLPGINQYGQYKTSVPVKVTNVQLASPANWSGTYYEDPDPVQRGAGRRRPQGRQDLPRTGTMTYQHLGNSSGHQAYYYSGGNNNNRGNNNYAYLGQINPNQTADYVEQIARMNQQRSNRR